MIFHFNISFYLKSSNLYVVVIPFIKEEIEYSITLIRCTNEMNYKKAHLTNDWGVKWMTYPNVPSCLADD